MVFKKIHVLSDLSANIRRESASSENDAEDEPEDAVDVITDNLGNIGRYVIYVFV